MKRYLKLPTYHWLVVFMISGAFAIAFAYSTYNLFHLSMANLNFWRQFGTEALREGALVQTVQILIYSGLSLFYYLGFKVCEADLVSRYNAWKNK